MLKLYEYGKSILAHQIEKSDVLPCEICYLTQVILHRAHVLLLNIGCIGRHVIS